MFERDFKCYLPNLAMRSTTNRWTPPLMKQRLYGYQLDAQIQKNSDGDAPQSLSHLP